MLEPGEVVNKYRVISLLVHGGMSSVYVVEHLKLPRRFALKLITSHLATDEAFLNRFRQEAGRQGKRADGVSGEFFRALVSLLHFSEH